ncbi:isochorismatase domain-containing protein 1-like [Styela clava]
MEALLVFGKQAKVTVLEEGTSCEELKNKFYELFPGQINKFSQSILQKWDSHWNQWVDLETSTIDSNSIVCKFRLINKETNNPCLGNLTPDSCAFLCCDMQERFKPAILHFDEITEVSSRLLKGASLLDIPVIVTEQYPKGLLHTVKELDISNAKAVVEKTVFSMMVPEVEKSLEENVKDLRSVILFGVEAHVCVQQTALDLLARGIEVQVIADACSSRSQVDRIMAFDRLRSQGAIITTAETVLLQLVKDKNHPKFKEIQGIIKLTPKQPGLLLGVQSSL